MPIDEFESEDGVVVDEHDGQGPNHYTVYHRKSDDNRPYVSADRVEIGGNATIVYGKAVMFGPARVETYPNKGQTWCRITPLEEDREDSKSAPGYDV